MSSVQVAVRMRPLNKREKQLSTKGIIHMKGNTTSIHKHSSVRGDKLKEAGKTFTFDFSYDSSDRGSPSFVSQEKIFQNLGSNVLKAAFEGFNTCVFAYGQTGSGKTYTMMGHVEDKGLVPRICEGLFREAARRSTTDAVSFHTEVSFLEIYNERVLDLLKKKTLTDSGVLRVREHPKHGPYVENLSKHVVHNYGDMEDLITRGNAQRTTAATGMNDLSSRSHAIFTIMFTQAWFDEELPRETLSKINLVDLAGSEKADGTRATGVRLKEGANINKSLVTLGSVISALADLRVGDQSTKKKQLFIPYRNSVLTWLLKNSIGGNSVTTMIATISPADLNYMETLNTLRYASRAKNVVNSPTVNEGGCAKVIRELQAEVKRLQRLLEEATQTVHGELSSSVKVKEKLHQNEAEVVALTKEWTSKWRETRRILQEEAVAQRTEDSRMVTDCHLPHLIGINEDLLSIGMIVYYLKEGRTLIGSDKASCGQDIVLQGPGLLSEHCVLENSAGTVTLFPQGGALCSVNGFVVTNSCRLTQGAIIQLGGGTRLRFNHATEASQLREEHQSVLLSTSTRAFTDSSTSTKNSSKVKLQTAGSLFTPMNVLTADTAASKDPRIAFTSATTQKRMTSAIPGRHPVPHTGVESDGDALRGGVSTRDGREQKRDSCHKSGPGLTSERLQTKPPSGAGVSSYKGAELWSGDASLQQTSVLGPGDGCGMKPGGNANEIQGVVTDCYKGRPGSSGSSLGSVSHLQSGGRTRSKSVLPQTSTPARPDGGPLGRRAACSPPSETTLEDQLSCGETDEPGGLQEIPRVKETRTAAATVQNSQLGFLFSRVSWMVQDAGRFIWSAPTVLRQITDVSLQPIGSRWSSHVFSLVRKSNVLSGEKVSQVFSMVSRGFIFSLFRDNHIFSMVKDLPLIQHIQMDITQHFQPEEAARMIQSCINSERAQLPDLTPRKTLSRVEELPDDVLTPKDIWQRDGSISDLQCLGEQDTDDALSNQGDKCLTEWLPAKRISETKVASAGQDGDEPSENSMTVQIGIQTLIEFPDILLNLQTLPLMDVKDALKSILAMSVFNSQNIVALHWLNVATGGQREPQPAVLILMETGLYALTSDSGSLLLFQHLPLRQLKEIQIGLAGQSLRLMGTMEGSVLCVYTHSQHHTKALCRAILNVICPGDSRVSQCSLLNGNLMKLCLDWQMFVPDLLLDAGLRVCCRFQKSLADLAYLLHCNMDQKTVPVGGVQLLLYTSVAVCVSPSSRSGHVAQLLLTETHLGLVQEDAGVYPTQPSTALGPARPRFHDLTLRQCLDVRCIVVHDEDESGSVRLDMIMANMRGRGHPESVTKADTPTAHSSSLAEVWKLTFSCSTEAACLINHLSNV